MSEKIILDLSLFNSTVKVWLECIVLLKYLLSFEIYYCVSDKSIIDVYIFRENINGNNDIRLIDL